MDVQEWPIDKVTPYENNPRRNDGAVEATANSISEFGWQQPIVVDKDGVIIVGHTRLKAAKKLGLKEVPVLVADKLSDEQVKAYRLADNKAGELADWDFSELDAELNQIADLDMSQFGFSDDDSNDDFPSGNDPDKYRDEDHPPEQFTNDFIVPPFSIINTAKGSMMKRKKEWLDLIQDDGSSRGGATPFGGFRNAGGNKASVMNPAVCEVITRWFAPQGIKAKTFDCFAGDTSFGFVSSYLGNSFTGIELRQEQVDFNNSRVDKFGLDAKYIQDDGRNVMQHLESESQDLLFSCPPYFDLEVYSDDANDASNQDSYEDFIAILDTAFTQATKALKEGRFAAIVVGDVRDKHGEYYDFPGDIKRIFKKAGLHFYNEILLQDPLGTAPVIARRSMVGRKVVKIHQNLLVFYKGDLSKVKESMGVIHDFDGLEELYDEGSDSES